MFCRPVHYEVAVGLFLGGALALCHAAEGNVRSHYDQRYHITRWTSEDGLPHNRVNALAQTPDGYLWAGTWFGLARFDGVRFTVFDEANTPAMARQEVNALAVDNEGTLWIGTADALLRFREGHFTRFTKADGLPDGAVWRLAASPNGGIWMHCSGHVLHWRDGRPAIDVRFPSAAHGDVRSIKEEEDGSVTVVTARAIKRITAAGELESVAMPDFTAEAGVDWGGAWQSGERFWVSGQKGLWLFSHGSWKQVRAGSCRANLGTFVHEDRSGALWIDRREAGFWRCSGEVAEPVKLGDRGIEQKVGCMLEDTEGHMWFGTAQGLFQLRPRLFDAVTTEDGLPHEQCRSVCEAPDGAIWVETKDGVARITGGQAQTFPDEPDRDSRHSILLDRQGAAWFSNGHYGLIRWKPGGETNWFPGGLPRLTLEALFLDREGRVWVGTGSGVTWFENGKPQAHWGESDLPTESVRSIYQTRDGAMWFGTWKAGAVRWKSGAGLGQSIPADKRGEPGWPIGLDRFTTTNGLADNRVLVFNEDVEGILWIGTHNGLSRFKNGRFFTFRIEQGLPNNVLNWMEEDEFGRFWFSCNRGIFRVDRSELNAVAEGRKTRANIAVYGTADGMPTTDTEGEHQPAGCKGRDGRIWFPTGQGVVVIDPRRVNDHKAAEAPPPVVIEQVTADGEAVYGDGSSRRGEALGKANSGKAHRTGGSSPQFRLKAGSASLLKFRYTANTFAVPRLARFQYRLVGRDNDWREITSERVAYYTDLRPGNYRFQVKAANSHGVWNETPAELTFALAPHFWQTWAFYVFCALTFVGAAAAVQAYRLRWQRRLLRAEQQQALADERARIARDLHDDLGTALTGVALELDVTRRHSGDGIAERVGESAGQVRALAERMREVVWAVNPKCDTVSSLAAFLEQQSAQFLKASGLRGRIEFPEHIPSLRLDSETRHQLALGVREALSNVVRHARATEVVLSLLLEQDEIIVRVIDNGRGLPKKPENGLGQGLENLRIRFAQSGRSFCCASQTGAGTTAEFRVRLNKGIQRPSRRS